MLSKIATVFAALLLFGIAAPCDAQTVDRSDTLSCSPAPCVLPPRQASQGGFESPIAADPTNPEHLILGSDYSGCPYPTGSAFSLTSDGGTDWTLYCMPSFFYKGLEYGGEGSPILGYDLNGVAYIGSYYISEGESPAVLEAVQKSSDGVNWSEPTPAAGRANYYPLDCWMTVDASAASPYANSVYVSCVIVGPSGTNAKNQVVVSHSSDGGITWQQVDVASTQTSPDVDSYTAMTVGRQGTVYLTWQYCDQDNDCGNGPVYIVFSKSTDGGNTWSKPQRIATVDVIYPLPNTQNVFVPDGPVIAADASSGAHSGNLYAAMYNWTGTFMQMQVIRSTNGGDTWSQPVPVSPGVTHDQFLPWMSVSPEGLVGVSWLDRRNDPENIDYQAYAGISSDGGLTFQNVQLTTAFSDPNRGTETQGIGYYTGDTWDGPDYFVAAWLDNSEGMYASDFVGGIRLK